MKYIIWFLLSVLIISLFAVEGIFISLISLLIVLSYSRRKI